MIHLRDIFLELIEDNSCVYCGHIVDEDLRKWFKKGGDGGTTAGGWDRYGSSGQKLGKCGGGKKVMLMPHVLVPKKLLNLVKKVEQHL